MLRYIDNLMLYKSTFYQKQTINNYWDGNNDRSFEYINSMTMLMVNNMY